MTGAPITCPTRPSVPVMFVGSARARQPLEDVPRASTAGTPAAQTTAREASSAQADSRSALKRVRAVAGAHGKTTTTSMAAHVLLGCGLDPGYLIGGVLSTTGTNAAWGTGEWLVVEADESDRSMLRLHVDVAVLTNVELDHHAAYGSLDELRDAYRAFLAGAPAAVVSEPRELLRRRRGPHLA